MSEEEIIGRLHGLLVTTFHYSGHTENGVFWEHSIYFPKDEKFYAEAIQVLLDLYNKEKEKNIKLQKRNNRQVKIINKKDKQIDELKQIAHNDFEERCRLTFELQKYLEEDNK